MIGGVLRKECDMSLQRFEQKNARISADFEALKKRAPQALRRRIDLSWSNWGFGVEPLTESVKRLRKYGVTYIELHGNRYGADLGYSTAETKRILADHGVKCAGVCGMFSAENDLACNRPHIRQRAIDYIRRQIDLARELGGQYLLVVPGAVGRPVALDAFEMERSAETLRLVAGEFAKAGILAAVEPIRAAEVSFCHTIADALRYIKLVGHRGVQSINGDVYHMLAGEAHIGEAILAAGSRLVNLHMADSNRCALGEGQLDLDTILRALYLVGYNRPGHFCTPEPLGPGGDPYPAMNGRSDPKLLDRLVSVTARTFREREAFIRGE